MTQKQAQEKGNRPAHSSYCLATTNSARAQWVPRRCGYDRWPVKIISDKDRSRVNFTPTDTTVAKLASIPIHEIPYPRDRRIAPEELKVYKLQAMLIRVKRERDSDLHLIIADLDKPKVRMIAEIPAPQCAEGTGHEDEYNKARALVLRISRGSVIELIGVGFFDFLHDTRGAAKNGFELHPVLSVRENLPPRQAKKADPKTEPY
jgi:hypothetical protein